MKSATTLVLPDEPEAQPNARGGKPRPDVWRKAAGVFGKTYDRASEGYCLRHRKRLQRRARLEMLADQKFQWHPSWKAVWERRSVSGAMVKERPGRQEARRHCFSSNSI